MMIYRRSAVSALLAALFLAGCAGNTAGTNDVGGPGPADASASSPADDPPTGRPSGKPDTVQTLTGTITAGVEPNCLLLNDAAGTHLLIISDAQVRTLAAVGASVTVVGTPKPGMMTTCQQGTPFVVSEARAD